MSCSNKMIKLPVENYELEFNKQNAEVPNKKYELQIKNVSCQLEC